MEWRNCSLLRSVWNLFEAKRPISGLHGPENPSTVRVKPASGEGRCQATLISSALCAAVILTFPVAGNANGWGKSGTFKLAGTSSKTIKSGWKKSQIKTSWQTTKTFELSKPGKKRPSAAAFRMPKGAALAKLGALIQHAESPRAGYDAVHGSAKRRPPKKPTDMTFAQLYKWINATPGQHHALGKYQFIPATLQRLQRKIGVSVHTKVTPAIQDRMANALYVEAGYLKFAEGKLSLQGFMYNLAKIWAGLPIANGRSYYHKVAGNRATISRSFYEKNMRKIFKL